MEHNPDAAEPDNKRRREAGRPPGPEPLHRTSVNLPESVYEQARREAFATRVPISTQLINAWKKERGID